MKLSRKAKASRANGAKSRGPKTPEGRLRSQTHAIRHGMLARAILLEGEDPEAFKLLMAELEHRFSPVDEVELGFIEEMAAAYWRMRRGWIAEAELLDQGVRGASPANYRARLVDALTGADNLAKITLLQRYETRLHRMFQRALKNLMTLRDERRNSEMSEQPEDRAEESQAQFDERLAALRENFFAVEDQIVALLDSTVSSIPGPVPLGGTPFHPERRDQKPAA